MSACRGPKGPHPAECSESAVSPVTTPLAPTVSRPPYRIAINGYGRIGRCYLRALHDSGSAVPETGWTLQVVSLWRDTPDGPALAAACAYRD